MFVFIYKPILLNFLLFAVFRLPCCLVRSILFSNEQSELFPACLPAAPKHDMIILSVSGNNVCHVERSRDDCCFTRTITHSQQDTWALLTTKYGEKLSIMPTGWVKPAVRHVFDFLFICFGSTTHLFSTAAH